MSTEATLTPGLILFILETSTKGYDMLRVAIIGVTGYGGEELLRLLADHPKTELTYAAASARFERRVPLTELYPGVQAPALMCGALDVAQAAQLSDVCLLALPHGQAMAIVPALLKSGRKIVDLSGDFRLRDPAAYDRWYHAPHAAPSLLSEAVYGLSEFFREQIRHARLVANPGCYATSVLLGTLPLLERVMPSGPVIVDAKSGYSGAGREAAKKFQADETGNLRPYKPLDEHQHLAEILQTITQVTGREVPLVFTPHIVPTERGLLSDLYIRLSSGVTADAVRELYAARYQCEPFVRWRGTDGLPSFKDVARSNRCDLGMKAGAEMLLIVSALDNLRKGAASQAIQNMNLMCGFDEATGLH